VKPLIRQRNVGDKEVVTRHDTLEKMSFYVEKDPTEWLFTDNETNLRTTYGSANSDHDYKKDSFHLYLVRLLTNMRKAELTSAAHFGLG
jgi:hypothetical protein